MNEYLNSATLLFMLMNPFLLVIYLVDVFEKIDQAKLRGILIPAGLIACVVLCFFAILGDAIFSNLAHVEFASFQIFGGTVFLLIGIQFVFRGPRAIEVLRGESPHLVGAIAMPILIGPGTISAAIVIGERHDPMTACIIIVLTVITSISLIIVLKSSHDYVRPRRTAIINRYIEVVGRIMALYIGTVSIHMIMSGIRKWVEKF
jgi:small neutral amino acid transporter SnatA (MarC family)